MPTRKIWDHAIDLKKTFKPWKERIYPLSKKKRESSELCGGSIEKRVHQTVKSPQTSPVFFVDKKNRSKQIVIDYCCYATSEFAVESSIWYTLYQWTPN